MYLPVVAAVLVLSTPAWSQSTEQAAALGALNTCLESNGLEALKSNMSVDRVRPLLPTKCKEQLGAYDSAMRPERVTTLVLTQSESSKTFEAFIERYRKALYEK